MMTETVHEARHDSVLFEGDCLPLAGMSVVKAKALLKDAGNIPYFADAIVNGRRVPVAHVLQPGDRLAFVQRFGVKTGNDQPIEQAIGEAVLVAYPELVEIADKVKALGLPADRSLDLMAGMVAEWVEQRFGPPGMSVLAILNEVIARLDRIESSRVPWSQKEIDILEALEEGPLIGEKLATRAGYEYDGNTKGVLSSLVKRGLIGNKRPGGYFLAGKRES
jgi:hypothetical protein